MRVITEEWNGTNWSEVNDITIKCREGEMQLVVQMQLYSDGGVITSNIGKTESYEYNGSTWSEGRNPSRHHVDGGGSQNDAISFGGFYA